MTPSLYSVFYHLSKLRKIQSRETIRNSDTSGIPTWIMFVWPKLAKLQTVRPNLWLVLVCICQIEDEWPAPGWVLIVLSYLFVFLHMYLRTKCLCTREWRHYVPPCRRGGWFWACVWLTNSNTLLQGWVLIVLSYLYSYIYVLLTNKMPSHKMETLCPPVQEGEGGAGGFGHACSLRTLILCFDSFSLKSHLRTCGDP